MGNIQMQKADVLMENKILLLILLLPFEWLIQVFNNPPFRMVETRMVTRPSELDIRPSEWGCIRSGQKVGLQDPVYAMKSM